MRSITAWFLLLLCLSNWIGGHLCFEVTYFMEVQRRMNQQETSIATDLQAAGVDSHVEILEEREVFPRGSFYDDFVFSTECNGNTIFYAVKDASETIEFEKVTVPADHSDQDNASKTALLKSLFKDFMMTQPLLPMGHSQDQVIANFSIPQMLGITLHTNLSPPPDLA